MTTDAVRRAIRDVEAEIATAREDYRRALDGGTDRDRDASGAKIARICAYRDGMVVALRLMESRPVRQASSPVTAAKRPQEAIR